MEYRRKGQAEAESVRRLSGCAAFQTWSSNVTGAGTTERSDGKWNGKGTARPRRSLCDGWAAVRHALTWSRRPACSE
jgi:hypothetical protein